MEMKVMKKHDEAYKAQAVKLAREVGNVKASKELGIPASTIGTWVYKAKKGEIDTGIGTQTPDSALTQAMEIKALKLANKELAQKNVELKCRAN
jgi:transposase